MHQLKWAKDTNYYLKMAVKKFTENQSTLTEGLAQLSNQPQIDLDCPQCVHTTLRDEPPQNSFSEHRDDVWARFSEPQTRSLYPKIEKP